MNEIKVGQVWRKQGPYGWLRIERILDPDYGEYDGGCHGCTVTSFPPQLKGIQLRGGKRFFFADVPGMKWEDQIKNNRFLLEDGWKRGDCANEL